MIDGKETQKVMLLCQYHEMMKQVLVKANERDLKMWPKIPIFEIFRFFNQSLTVKVIFHT